MIFFVFSYLQRHSLENNLAFSTSEEIQVCIKVKQKREFEFALNLLSSEVALQCLF